ncbi:DUF4347 domain-containing protein [Neoroseomonas lacus]|uniref:DUF4347 domain-containing protein n=1 Tax=Neoroseomonas lacus TaxID=287609 RepID=A0A917NPF3_9PROT|nr:DUF4347 domain-containing protein [Neoroseomonas lacus]GGJ16298.1 hypothetical protein GCM10011320_24540 [Neoroseomonas lacus]
MIPIPQPALALNSSDFPTSSHYTMEHEVLVRRIIRPEAIVDMVSAAARSGRLHAVIINAHGMAGPDGVALGTGLHLGNVHLWGAVHGLIERIWMCACQVADTLDGQRFCQSLAVVTGAEVVASSDPQSVGGADREFAFDWNWRLARIPPLQIDDFEGHVMLWGPDGVVQDYAPNPTIPAPSCPT